VPRFHTGGADRVGPGAVPRPGTAGGYARDSRVAELLFQIADDRAAAVSRARSVHSTDEAEEYAALDAGRGLDYPLRAGVLRLVFPRDEQPARGSDTGGLGGLQTLRGFPPSGVSGTEQGVDHRHIADRVFQGVRHFRIVADGDRKKIRLNGELVGDRKGFYHGAGVAIEFSPVVDEDATSVCPVER
jgi:hypothetical protein